jgi:hypothetical protein
MQAFLRYKRSLLGLTSRSNGCSGRVRELLSTVTILHAKRAAIMLLLGVIACIRLTYPLYGAMERVALHVTSS